MLEVGCGAGNTVFPLLTQQPDSRLFVYACDFAPSAVNIVKVKKKKRESAQVVRIVLCSDVERMQPMCRRAGHARPRRCMIHSAAMHSSATWPTTRWTHGLRHARWT